MILRSSTAGCLHSNANALSRHPFQDCGHCWCQAQQDGMSPQVATMRLGAPEEEWLMAVDDQEWQAAQDNDRHPGQYGAVGGRQGKWVDAPASYLCLVSGDQGLLFSVGHPGPA